MSDVPGSPSSDDAGAPPEGSRPLPTTKGSPEALCRDGRLPHPLATHCLTCHASWTRASKSAHCMTCHRTFSSPTPFDVHLKTDKGCNPPETVLKAGKPYFREPRLNVWGTLIWSKADTRYPDAD